MKYETLLNTLDKICDEAPDNFVSYKVDENNPESLNQARSKAFIHLYLKVKCGLASFLERHNFITEGTQDGGVDAYYIDRENKKLYLIQSKFRTTKDNFEKKKITADDLVSMEVQRILKGEEKDSRGNSFSAKIKKFQNEWSKISDHALYEYLVIILGNLENYTDEQIKRIIDNSDHKVFDFNRTYKELVFPLCSGTYYDPKEIKITIDLVNKEQSTLKQEISTNLGDFPIRVIFVPTKEIGRIMSRYKNAILKYNPRNFLSLSNNKVNYKIMESIINNKANDFAIYNNGITIIADSFQMTESTGTKNMGQIIMLNPQIINGGQTAYVLSKIYEGQKEQDYSVFDGKEVMLKVIILTSKKDLNIDFIEQISNATNQQTRVEEADRRSNDKIQLAIEEAIFDTFGYFYERKKGEFYNGIERKYIDKNLVVNRDSLLKAYLAWQGDAANARRSGTETMFKEKRFKEIMKKYADFKKMFFAYKLLTNIETVEKTKKHKFGPSMKYGKMAIIAAIGTYGISDEDIDVKTVDAIAKEKIEHVESLWGDFINYVTKKLENISYITDENSLDLDVYYKGRTVNSDIKSFFKKFIA
ncbi:MAG: AIPR family protein [Thermodesulfovibrionales bacterium]